MKDQSAALQWIQNHISDFGGDPTNVTVSGESSGAVDVGLHLVSPLSKGAQDFLLNFNVRNQSWVGYNWALYKTLTNHLMRDWSAYN